MTDEQLKRLLAADKAATDSRATRERVIAELHHEGVALRDLARALHMTHQGIRKIIDRQP